MAQATAVMDPSTTSLALLALPNWRIGQPELARVLAERGLEHMALFKQTSFHSFHGFASLAEVCLQLWEARPDDSGLAHASRRAVQALRSYARPFPVYHAWAWRNNGTYLWLAGRRVQAARSWQKSLTLATRFKMPYEEALARYEIARHLAANDPRGKEHRARAAELFASLGAACDLEQAQRLPVTDE